MSFRVLPYLRLVRVGTLFSPGADVVAGLCVAAMPWSLDAARAVMASILVYAAGMVLNDHADRREDAEHRPERPIPSGRIAPGTALGLGIGLLVLALAVAPWFAYHAVLAVLVLAYDYVLKRNPLAGALTMGSLRGLNLIAGAVAATHVLPTGGAILIAAAVYGLYIVSVTILGTFEDAARVPARAVVGVQAVPPVAACLALLALPEPWPAAALGAALAATFVWRVRRRGGEWDRAAIRESMTWLLLGTMLYTSLLCLGTGRAVESAVIAAAIVPARLIARRVALT